MLRKIEKMIGKEPKGSVPFVARTLAETLFQEGSGEINLPQHPIALLVAAALTSHYEAVGDLIGNRIYRDLNRVYLLLQQDRKQNLIEAEKIIDQNLERDPLNLWFITRGRGTKVWPNRICREGRPPFTKSCATR